MENFASGTEFWGKCRSRQKANTSTTACHEREPRACPARAPETNCTSKHKPPTSPPVARAQTAAGVVAAAPVVAAATTQAESAPADAAAAKSPPTETAPDATATDEKEVTAQQSDEMIKSRPSGEVNTKLKKQSEDNLPNKASENGLGRVRSLHRQQSGGPTDRHKRSIKTSKSKIDFDAVNALSTRIHAAGVGK